MEGKFLANVLGNSGPQSRQYIKSNQELVKQQKEKAEVQSKYWLVSWARQKGTMSGEGDVLLQR